MHNHDERYICALLNRIPGVKARLATPEEDGGPRKADVVAEYNGKTFYFQVSRQKKSKRERRKLLKRGTIPIHTHRFLGLSRSREELLAELRRHLGCPSHI